MAASPEGAPDPATPPSRRAANDPARRAPLPADRCVIVAQLRGDGLRGRPLAQASIRFDPTRTSRLGGSLLGLFREFFAIRSDLAYLVARTT
jgi:hypothetical protein